MEIASLIISIRALKTVAKEVYKAVVEILIGILLIVISKHL